MAFRQVWVEETRSFRTKSQEIWYLCRRPRLQQSDIPGLAITPKHHVARADEALESRSVEHDFHAGRTSKGLKRLFDSIRSHRSKAVTRELARLTGCIVPHFSPEALPIAAFVIFLLCSISIRACRVLV